MFIQNHFQFLSEVGSLLSKIISQDFDDSSESDQTKRAAAQAGLLMGNTFNYAVRFTRDLNKTKRKVAVQIATVTDVLKEAIGIAGLAAPGSTSVTDAAALANCMISEMIESWALRPDQELNITETAKQLACLSDGLQKKSCKGFWFQDGPSGRSNSAMKLGLKVRMVGKRKKSAAYWSRCSRKVILSTS